MAKEKVEKTNVIRVLESKKVTYNSYNYENTGAVSDWKWPKP